MGRHTDIDERLYAFEAFRGLSPRTMRQIRTLATPIERPAGATLTRQGRRGVELVLVLDGTVAVERDGGVIAHRGAGDFLGEMSLLGDGVQTATAVVTAPVSALVVGKPDFWTLVADVPGLGEHLRRTMVERQGGAVTDGVGPAPADPVRGHEPVAVGRFPVPVLGAV